MYLVVVFAVLMHFTWAVCLMLNPNVVGVTGINTLSYIVPNPIELAITLYLVAALATIGIIEKSRFAFVLMLPQQLVLFISSWGAFHAMVLGQFADGVPRSHTFLITDQCHLIICAALHFIAAMRKAMQN